MINLIRNEFIKIFKKKSLYITFAIILVLVILLNVMYNYGRNFMYGVYYGHESQLEENRQYLATLDSSDSAYASAKTLVEVGELRAKYGEESWQAYAIDYSGVYEYIYDVNRYTYGYEQNEELLAVAVEEYNSLIERLDSDDWRYFVRLEIDKKQEEINNLKQQEGENLNHQIFSLEFEIEILEMRLSKDIPYISDNVRPDALNSALETYRSSIMFIRSYENGEFDDTYEYKQSYYSSKEYLAFAEYMMDNKVDLYEVGLRMMLMDVFNSYDLFIIIFIVMIAGGIVSDEFSKGTVKLWLVRPHSRMKLLLAKFIASMIMILIVMIVMVLLQLIVGGLILGFDSLEIPALVYDFNNNELIEMSIFKHILIQGITVLPFFILVATIAFAISTLFSSTAIAITIGMLGYISGDIINMLVVQYDIKFMYYFITMNWHLDNYLFGRLPTIESMNFSFSAVVCIAYFALMMVPTFIIFKRKNIKNV